jgi:FkbM family methyltransferase
MKKAINYLLSLFGYAIVKRFPQRLFKSDVTVKVGKYEIVMPSINPLIHTYASLPDFSSELSRIVIGMYNKYPLLSAFDIGANTGDTIAIIKTAKDIPVISVEGDVYAFSYLKRNISLFNNVTIFNNYLGEEEKKLKVKIEKDGWNSTVIADEQSAKEIDIRTFDSILLENKVKTDNFKLLKIDTEGFDTIIIRGAYNYIKTIKPVIYFEYNRDNMMAIGEDGLSTLKQLKEIGYSRVLFYDDRGRFLLSANLDNSQLLEELNHYANGKDGLVYYYNICVFDRTDEDVADEIVKAEMALN